MSRMHAFRSALASIVILAVLRAVPAYPWHGSGKITALAIDPQTPTTLYAGTCDRGVFKSTDEGADWSTTGLTNIYVFALAIDPQTPTTLYAGATPNDCTGAFVGEWYQANVYKSTDGGTTWSATGLVGVQVTALAIDPKTPTTLYAGSYWEGVFKSTDGGTTWSATGLFSVQTLAIDPVTPSTVYAATAFVGEEGFTWEGGVFKSTDGGATWSATGLADGSFGGLAIDPRPDRDPLTPATVYAGGYDLNDKGVFKSTDGGATWSVASLPDLIGVLAIDPQTPTTLYGGSAPGVLKSTDGGAAWSPVNIGLTDTILAFGFAPNVWVLAIDPVSPNTLYAGTAIGVFKSVDSGANWSPTGLFQHSPLVSLSLNPTAVFYGASSTGTVTLVTPAPAGGITVALLSNNPSIATVPASVTVPAGETSANFIISTTPDPWTAWAVNISATFDGVTRGANLMVYATTLSSFSLNPTSVTGGSPSTGTVGLSAAAPAGGATIPLSSSDPAVATLPASVTVPAGATWANFTVSTSSVTASTAVRISAANYWAVLTVTPDSPPETTITSAVDRQGNKILDGGTTRSNEITFGFAGTDNGSVTGFECSLDAAAFTPCTSPITYRGVSKGQHTFQVRAIDNSGFRDPTPATFTWTRP